MKIGRLMLKDFGPYEESEVVFDQPLSVFRGDNAQGKTKAVQAIQLSLTCQSDGTQSDGKGASDKIRLGADKALITLGIDTAKGSMELLTTYHSSGRRIPVIRAGTGGPDAEPLATGFQKFLDASKERLSCCLDSEFFIKEKPADQKAILAALVLPTKYDWDAEPESAAMKVLAAKHFPATDWTRPPVVVIDAIYGDDKTGAYSARKAAKATLVGIHIPSAPVKPDHDANEVQVKLNILRTQQTKEAKKVKQGGTVQVGRVEQNLTQEREKLAKAHADRKAAQDQQVCIEADMLDGPAMTAHKQMAAKRKEYDEIGQQIAAFNEEIAAQKEAQDIFSGMLVGENGHPVEECPCPTCTQMITKAFITARVGDHQKLEQQAEAAKAALQLRQKGLGDIASAEAALKRQEEKTSEKLAQVKAVTAATERITFIETSMKDLEAALESAKAAEANPIDTSVLDALNTELGEWEARLAPAVQYNSTLTQIADAQKRFDEQNVRVSELETLCAYFGPKGVKSKLIDQHIGTFTEKVNEILGVWGYAAKLQIEPEYKFEVVTPKTAPRYLPLKELSGFERKAFAVALQCAIAVFSKIKMVLVDAADVMIEGQRNRLLGCVKSLTDSKTLDQAVIMLADKSRQVPKKDGVAFYFVENGQIERL